MINLFLNRIFSDRCIGRPFPLVLLVDMLSWGRISERASNDVNRECSVEAPMKTGEWNGCDASTDTERKLKQERSFFAFDVRSQHSNWVQSRPELCFEWHAKKMNRRQKA